MDKYVNGILSFVIFDFFMLFSKPFGCTDTKSKSFHKQTYFNKFNKVSETKGVKWMRKPYSSAPKSQSK